MKKKALLLTIFITGCSSVNTVPSSICNATNPPSIITAAPDSEYKLCGTIQVKGHAVNNPDALNEYLLTEAAKLRADAVLLLNKEDGFNWSEGRSIKADAIAIQYQ